MTAINDEGTLEELAFEQYTFAERRLSALKRDPRCPSHVLLLAQRAARVLFETYEAIRVDIQ